MKVHKIKRGMLFACLSSSVFIITCSMGMSAAITQNCKTMQFASLVQKRYYHIKRLQKSVHSFFSISGDHKITDAMHTRLSEGLFQKKLFHHSAVSAIVKEIIHKKSITPFYKVWRDFISYKYIDNDTFTSETITLLLVLYNSLFFPNISFVEHSIDQSIDRITAMTLECCDPSGYKFLSDNENYCMYHHGKENKLNDFESTNQLQDDGGKELIINNNVRFYHIQRMLKAMLLLSKTYTVSCSKKDTIQFSCLQWITLSHETIQHTIVPLFDTGKLGPVMSLWQQFTSYEFIESDLFLREFTLTVVAVYIDLLSNINSSYFDNDIMVKNQVNEMIELYNRIESLHLPELLDFLDELVEHSAEIIHEYELDSIQISWSGWLKKYWWALPIAVSTLFYELNDTSKTWTMRLRHYWWVPPIVLGLSIFNYSRS